MIVHGEFDVKLQPMDSYHTGSEGVQLARLSIDKTFHGPLSATSHGEMLSAQTASEGSAGYVAIEQVTGTLEGKQGSFVLQHFGIVRGDDYRLILEVIPDSGTGDLAGLRGTMRIDASGDHHRYEFDYTLRG